MKEKLWQLWLKLKSSKIYLAGGVFLVLALLASLFFLATQKKKPASPPLLPTPLEKRTYFPPASS